MFGTCLEKFGADVWDMSAGMLTGLGEGLGAVVKSEQTIMSLHKASKSLMTHIVCDLLTSTQTYRPHNLNAYAKMF